MKSINDVIREHSDIVYYYAGKFANKSSAIYNDLVSEGFFGMWQAIESWEPCLSLKLRPYLKVRVCFIVIDYLRKQKRYNKCQGRDDMELERAKENDIDLKIIELEIQSAIDSLPDRQREIVYGLFYEKLPLRVVGEEWGVSKQRIQQIKDVILNHLSKDLSHLKDAI